ASDARRHRLSFPTRRSSDLKLCCLRLAAPIVGGAVAHFGAAAAHGIEDLERGNQLARGVDTHLEAIPAHLLDIPGQGVCTSTERSEEHTSELQSRENLVCRL